MKRLTGLMAGMCLVSGAALAQSDSDTPGAGGFERLDLDQDGKISVSEAEADRVVLEGFARADRNGDGFLSPEEFAVVENPSPR